MGVARRVRFGARLGTWATRTTVAFLAAAAIGLYLLLGYFFGVDIAVPFWQGYLVAVLVVLIGFSVVMLGSALHSLVLRMRPTATQESEINEAFQQGQAKVELRKADYRLGRSRIEEIARPWGYRLATTDRSFRLLLRFRTHSISAEERELADAFDGSDRSVRIEPPEYQVARERIIEIAVENGYRLDESVSRKNDATLTFHVRGGKEGRKLPWYRNFASLALVMLFWPLVVAGFLFWVFFRAFALYLLGVFGYAGLSVIFPSEEAGDIIGPAILYGYLPLVTVFSLVRIVRDWRSSRRPQSVQCAEIERRFSKDEERVHIQDPRYSLSSARIEEIGQQYGYRLLPKSPRDPRMVTRFERQEKEPAIQTGSGVTA